MKKELTKPIKTYKAFGKGLICKGFQYEVGKQYEHSGEIEVCESGFHSCENPLDVLNYYNLCDSEFAETEVSGTIDENSDDSKMASSIIKINAKLDLPLFIKASIDFLWNKCKKDSGNSSQLASSGDGSKLASSGDGSKLASSGDDSKLASSGNDSKLASSGNDSKLASSGDDSQLASSGYGSQLASSGDGSKLASSGDDSKLASSGNDSQLASSGYGSQLASSGDGSQLASSGDDSKLALNGANSVGANIGVGGIIKGKKGCWITLAEYDNNYNIKYVASAKIDGRKIKEDVFYKLQNKKFVEVK